MRDWLPPPEFSAAGELDTTTDIVWGQRERYFLCANFEAASFAPDAAGRLLGLPQPLIPYEMRPVARGLSDYVQSDAFRSYASSLAGLLLKKGAAALPDAISAFCSFHSSRMGRRDHDERISRQSRITQAVIENYMGPVAVLKLASWSSWHCDSIRQLSPGVSRKMTTKVMTGLTVAKASEIAKNLGLQTPLSPAQLSMQLSDKFALTVSLMEQREVSDELVIANTLEDNVRRYALWRMAQNHQLFVAERVVPVASSQDHGRSWTISWKPLGSTVTQLAAEISDTTYVDLPVNR